MYGSLLFNMLSHNTISSRVCTYICMYVCMYVCMVNLTASDVDGERTIGVLTKVDIMDHGTDCCDILLGMYVCMYV